MRERRRQNGRREGVEATPEKQQQQMKAGLRQIEAGCFEPKLNSGGEGSSVVGQLQGNENGNKAKRFEMKQETVMQF